MKIRYILQIVAMASFSMALATGAERSSNDSDRRSRLRNDRQDDRRHKDRKVNRPTDDVPSTAAVFPLEFRSIDGTNNNVDNPNWGAAAIEFIRVVEADYADGLDEPSGADRASARAISSAVSAQDGSIPNSEGVSDFVWQWGQFLDHDITETPVIDPAEPFDIEVPLGDAWFDPFNTGTVTIGLNRSFYEHDADGVRQQFNEITAFIDASNVYGSDEERAADLRTNDGTGRLRTSDGDLLPFNINELPNAPSDDPGFYIGGDVRANEQVGLIAMHTLFVREHNRWADFFRERHPDVSGDVVYNLARAIVGAEMQAITYREFLPRVLGRKALKSYRGYRADVDPSISNIFATASYRFGHSMLSTELLRLDVDGNVIEEGNLSLAEAFFNPDEIAAVGIDPVLRGLASQAAQEVDTRVIDDVRNFLFGPPGAGGFDLVSLNIQRGRDHGLPSYNTVREAYGLEPVTAFTEISSDTEISDGLASVYASPDDIDLWVGGLAEDHVEGALVGETLQAVLGDQFERLRDGDRFWYQRYLPRRWVNMVERQTLSEIIRRNTDIGWEIQSDVFVVSEE
ncbi:peroxidase family protein [Rubellicoccus peritrichatus]|uniref:Peroxidase family protein n=1 Tax=Rubellicoccus peritrichatus TaxID=3080537 RepID=A0AAQ3LCA5_9BACT|nr:peroxidase family protein [Puniceicoccus sp. CR14]WOO41230.1 peroxidase family protein [Puniceicoccus sp. CR14]